MPEVRLKFRQERRSFARQADEQKEQAVKMRAKGISLSATVRVAGASVCGAVGRALATERLTRFLAWRTGVRQSGVRASIAAFDEM